MANEAKVITLLGNDGDPVECTVTDASAIPKGALIQLHATSMTGSISDTDGDYFLGVARSEKVASDGQTQFGVYTNGLFNMHSTTGMTLGVPQKIEDVNLVTDANDDTIANAAEVVGLAMSTVGAGGSGPVLIRT